MCGIFLFNDKATSEIYTLSRPDALPIYAGREGEQADEARRVALLVDVVLAEGDEALVVQRVLALAADHRDRKSTRLNSSHANISYAVFCLKKKNPNPPLRTTPPHLPTAA